VHKEYLAHAVKMTKTMETMAGAMQGCMQMMNTMIQMQANQQQIFSPFGFHTNMQHQQSSMISKAPMAPEDIPD
jgi:predicted GNAT family N-acyltransferase